MVGWHHHLNGQESEQSLGDSEGQGSLSFCSPWGHKSPTHLASEQKRQVNKRKTSRSLSTCTQCMYTWGHPMMSNPRGV